MIACSHGATLKQLNSYTMSFGKLDKRTNEICSITIKQGFETTHIFRSVIAKTKTN